MSEIRKKAEIQLKSYEIFEDILERLDRDKIYDLEHAKEGRTEIIKSAYEAVEEVICQILS